MFRPASLLILLAFACGYSGTARALGCGDTITHDVTLTADLHCSTGWEAFYVPVSGVTIDLNGHTLSGTRGLRGIGVLDASNVRIVNGTIRGFWGGVTGLRAHGLGVYGVTFKDLDGGVLLNHTQGARIIDNDFAVIGGAAISFAVPVGAGHGAAGSHYVGYNRFAELGTGIELCGYGNSGSTLIGNSMEKINDYGVHASDGSGGHHIQDNAIAGIDNTGIVLRGTRGNEITGNVMQEGRLGIAMIPEFTGRCVTGPLTTPYVRDNRIEGNSLFKLDTAVSLGLGAVSKPLVFKNQVRHNKIYDNDTGLFFLEDAHSNDATGNAYHGTMTPVVDLGYWNSY